MRLSVLTRAIVLVVIVAGTLAAASAANAARYIVVFRGSDVPRDAARQIERAGGTLAFSYDQIGVVLADSNDPMFLSRLDGRHRVSSAAEIFSGDDDGDDDHDDDDDERGGRYGRLPNEPATDADTFSALQWNMQRINSPAAHAITGGSPVGARRPPRHAASTQTIPTCATTSSVGDSVSCVDGIPSQAADASGRPAFFDTNGHGTHTAGAHRGGRQRHRNRRRRSERPARGDQGDRRSGAGRSSRRR